jgi:hypothetical protein
MAGSVGSRTVKFERGLENWRTLSHRRSQFEIRLLWTSLLVEGAMDRWQVGVQSDKYKYGVKFIFLDMGEYW